MLFLIIFRVSPGEGLAPLLLLVLSSKYLHQVVLKAAHLQKKSLRLFCELEFSLSKLIQGGLADWIITRRRRDILKDYRTKSTINFKIILSSKSSARTLSAIAVHH